MKWLFCGTYPPLNINKISHTSLYNRASPFELVRCPFKINASTNSGRGLCNWQGSPRTYPLGFQSRHSYKIGFHCPGELILSLISFSTITVGASRKLFSSVGWMAVGSPGSVGHCVNSIYHTTGHLTDLIILIGFTIVLLCPLFSKALTSIYLQFKIAFPSNKSINMSASNWYVRTIKHK